ncbi:MAG: hypothetical protein ABIR18_13690 [Chitinophagaceae bacterium]
MNQFFSFNRFCLLVLKHWADNKKRYLLSVIAFIGLLITWFVLTMLTESSGRAMSKGIQQVTFIFALFATGSFYASQYFRDLGSSVKGINFLLVPASAFEKILCSLLYTVLFFFIVFTTAFYLADILMVSIYDRFAVADDPTGQRGLLNVFDATSLPFDGKTTINLLLIFLSIQSAFLLGSVYFKKYSFIKTIISGFVIFFVVFCFVFLLYKYLMPKGEFENGFLTSYRVETGGKNDYLVQIPVWVGKILHYLLMYGTAPFLWIVTYFRLKEKQV